MEVFYKPSSKITLKFDCTDLQDVFKQLGPVQEVLENCACGKCKSDAIRFVHRKVDKYDYHELQCTKCFAKLSLGTNEDKQLFPRRYKQDPNDPKKPLLDHDGKKVWLPDNGWIKWNAETKEYV